MISEEYSYSDIKEYLYDNIDLLITGESNSEERNHYFFDEWYRLGKNILTLRLEDSGYVLCSYIQERNIVGKRREELCVGIPRFLRGFDISNKRVLLDLSGLSHVLIMFLTKQLLKYLSPQLLFAAYIRPNDYNVESDDIGYQLSQRIGAVSAVPGFSKRESERQTLCAFLGFEGVRLKGVLETVNTFSKLIPIVAFPSGNPHWYNITMLNSMNILQSEGKNLSVYKCYSESVFEAIDLLNKTIPKEESVVLAPLGTRPHSMACAIFSCLNTSARIVYDFAVENEHRAIGVSDITIYHLSSFIQN